MYSFQEVGKRIDSCRFFRSFFVLYSFQIHHPCLSTQYQFNSLREQILNNSFQLKSPQQWVNSNSIQILWQNSWIQLCWILFWGIELELIREFESIRTGLLFETSKNLKLSFPVTCIHWATYLIFRMHQCSISIHFRLFLETAYMLLCNNGTLY